MWMNARLCTIWRSIFCWQEMESTLPASCLGMVMLPLLSPASCRAWRTSCPVLISSRGFSLCPPVAAEIAIAAALIPTILCMVIRQRKKKKKKTLLLAMAVIGKVITTTTTRAGAGAGATISLVGKIPSQWRRWCIIASKQRSRRSWWPTPSSAPPPPPPRATRVTRKIKPECDLTWLDLAWHSSVHKDMRGRKEGRKRKTALHWNRIYLSIHLLCCLMLCCLVALYIHMHASPSHECAEHALNTSGGTLIQIQIQVQVQAQAVVLVS